MMINSFTKNAPIQKRKSKTGFSDLLRSKIQINSKIQSFCSPRQYEFLPLQIQNDEKNAKKKFMDQQDKSLLEIVLWNNDKTKKLVNFKCSPGQNQIKQFSGANALKTPLTLGNSDSMSKELGNVKIKIFECANGELSYKFDFETLESSKVESQTILDEQEFKWKGGKDDLDFKINLNQNIKKESWNSRFGTPCVGKENILNSLFQPTIKNGKTPSPKSCSFFRFLIYIKKKLNFLFPQIFNFFIFLKFFLC